MELASVVPIVAVLAAAALEAASRAGISDLVSTVLGRALDLGTGRVDEALIGALERLRRTLNRYDY
jgi:hypothetical protein